MFLPSVEFTMSKRLTDALEAIPERHIEVGGEASDHCLAVCADAAGQHPDLRSVKEFHRLPNQGAEQLRPVPNQDCNLSNRWDKQNLLQCLICQSIQADTFQWLL